MLRIKIKQIQVWERKEKKKQIMKFRGFLLFCFWYYVLLIMSVIDLLTVFFVITL